RPPSPKLAPSNKATAKDIRPIAGEPGKPPTSGESAEGAAPSAARKDYLASGATEPSTISRAPEPPVEIPAAPAPPATVPGQPSTQEVIAMEIRQPAGQLDDMVMRGEGAQTARLLNAKRVYLDISGAQSGQVRQQLLQRLPIDNKFSLTGNQ